MQALSPFRFIPHLKSVLWGGERIAAFKGVTPSMHAIGESWEISGLRGKETVVAEGADAGMTLPQLIDRYRDRLLGNRVYDRYGTDFPLLVKLIDAKQDLSIQVHPDEALARARHRSHGKAEMWYIIDAAPDAQLIAGMCRPTTPAEFSQALLRGRLFDLVARHNTHRGDVFYLPPGRLHSIGAGNFLVEVQQPSDLTYRVYDYDRVDANGNRRELHTAMALDAIDYDVADDCVVACPPETGETELVSCPQFTVKRLVVEEEAHLEMPDDAFLVIVCIEGGAVVESLNADGQSFAKTPIKRGHSLLIPAETPSLKISGTTTLITATV